MQVLGRLRITPLNWRCFLNLFTTLHARRDFRRPCASVNDGMANDVAHERKNGTVKGYQSGSVRKVDSVELIVYTSVYCPSNVHIHADAASFDFSPND